MITKFSGKYLRRKMKIGKFHHVPKMQKGKIYLYHYGKNGNWEKFGSHWSYFIDL